MLGLAGFGARAGVVITSLYSFGAVHDTNGNLLDGANPQAALALGGGGCFYGTTGSGGTNGVGTVFKISTQGAMTSLWSFSDVTDGAIPVSSLVPGNENDGSFYGTTWSGGNHGFGTVFKISTNGEFTCLYSFTGTNDGASPRAALVQGRDGYFYGTTSGGGRTNNLGTVFKISTNGVLSTLYSFGTIQDVNGVSLDGAAPQAALVVGSDGNFYGTTSGLGDAVAGTVFKMSTNGELTTLYSFTGNNDGASPNGLLQGSDGNFYGTSELDGWYVWGGPVSPLDHSNNGNVFKISPDGVFRSLYSFDTNNGTNGACPCAGLVQGGDGCFYGTTSQGGTNGWGTVFKLTMVPEPQLTIVPFGPLVLLTWPTNAFVFNLQFITSLGSSANWATDSVVPVVIGEQNLVIKPITDSQMFYRLRLAP